MPTPANAINATASGILGYNATSFSGSPLTQYNILVGGATSDLISNVAPAAAGKVLQSGGASANPSFSTSTYPSTAGTNRTILISDGTNFINSTETYATPGTSGNFMTSDGTNWTSAAPGGSSGKALNLTKVTITNSQLKAATAISLIAAQGAGTVIIPAYVTWKFVYGGTNAFTNSPGNQINYGSTYGTTPAIINLGGITFWQATASQIYQSNGGYQNISTNVENQALNWTMSTAATGNAANNNTVNVTILWYTATM